MIIYDYINSDVQLLGILPGGKDSPVASALFHIVSSEKMHVFMILILDRDWYWMILGNCAESFHLSILVQ